MKRALSWCGENRRSSRGLRYPVSSSILGVLVNDVHRGRACGVLLGSRVGSADDLLSWRVGNQARSLRMVSHRDLAYSREATSLPHEV